MSQNLLVTHQINRFVTYLNKSADSLLRQYFGIDYIDFLLLQILGYSPDVNQNYLAQASGYTKSLVSKRVFILLDKKWVKITSDTTDRRQNFVTLTAIGKQKVQEMNLFLEEKFLQILSPSETKKIQEFSEFIVPISEKLKGKNK